MRLRNHSDAMGLVRFHHNYKVEADSTPLSLNVNRFGMVRIKAYLRSCLSACKNLEAASVLSPCPERHRGQSRPLLTWRKASLKRCPDTNQSHGPSARHVKKCQGCE